MRILAPVAAVVLVGVLSACSAPAPAPTFSGEGAPGTIDVPLPRLAVGCDDLFAPDTVPEFAGSPVTVVSGDEGSPDSWWDVVSRQSGTLTCTWSIDPDRVTLFATVVPDSAEYFVSDLDSPMSNYYERYNEVGDRSVHACAYGQCTFSILVEDYLIEGYANRPDLMDELDLLPLIEPVLDELVDSVRRAIPDERAPWVVPDRVLAGWGSGCAEDAPVAELGEVFGMTDAYATGTDWGISLSAMLGQVGPSWCTLGSGQATTQLYPEVVVVPGGAWADGLWKEEPPTAWYGTTFEPAEIEGFDTAYVVSDDERYTLLATLGGSVVSLNTSASSEQEFLGWAAGIATLLRSDS